LRLLRLTDKSLAHRKVIFEGNIQHYIWQISFIYFKLIKNTVEVYQECFPPGMMSACVKWAKRHVDEHNAILATQLSSVDDESEDWIACMTIARDHSRMLMDVGLRFQGGAEGGHRQRPMPSSNPVGLGLN
jgi:hypothetical protein